MPYLPRNYNLSFLMNKEVEGINFGLYQFQIHFQDAIKISIECEARYKPQGSQNEDVWKAGDRNEETRLVRLLGSQISNIKIEEMSLELSFSNGDRLRLINKENGYESYQICHGSEIIVV